MRNRIATMMVMMLLLVALQVAVWGREAVTAPTPDSLLLYELGGPANGEGANPVIERGIVFTNAQDPLGSELTDRPVVISRGDYNNLWLGAIFHIPAEVSGTITVTVYVQSGCRPPGVPVTSDPIMGPSDAVFAAGFDLTQFPDILTKRPLSYKATNSVDSSESECIDFQVNR